MRKIYFTVFFIIVLTALAVGYYYFKSQIRPVAPVRSTLDSTLTLPVSTIRIPVVFKIKDLERMVNSKLKGGFIQEWIPVGDKKKDSIFLALERTDSIHFKWTTPTLSANIPLRVSFLFRKRTAGIRIQNDKPVVAEVVLYLKSQIMLDDNWGIKSKTSLSKVVWKKEPTIKVAFVNVNLRKLAESYLEKNQEKIINRFDSVANELLDARRIVEKIWSDIQKPIILKKTKPQVGLSAQAEDLMYRWHSNSQGIISGMVTLKAKLYAWFEEPGINKIAPLPKYKLAERADEDLDLFVMARLPYRQLNTFANEKLKGISYHYKSYSIDIQNAEFYGSRDELALMMRMKGTVKGRVYLKAQPYFDTLYQVVGLRNLRYDLMTEEVLVNTAEWLLRDNLISILSDTVKTDISDELEALPKLIEQGIEKSKAGQKMTLNVDSLTVTSHASLITGKDIQWIFRARGKAGIELDKGILEGRKYPNKVLK